ncbi:MAG TPA: hypothetical protein V6C72_12625, partial [Chroococcales cyanobacterium]
MDTKSNRQKTIKSIRDLNNRVSVADVVAKSGLSLSEASAELNAIAAQTRATLQVDNLGEIQYCFPNGFAYIYFAHGIRRALLSAWDKVFRIAFFVFRISFGLMLLFSLWCIFGTILLFQSIFAAWLGSPNAVARMWGDFFGLLGRIGMSELITWRQYSAASGGSILEAKGNRRQGFLLDCYSFLFGEGDPNEGLDEERWQLIAQVIRLNEGVVIGEHLAPYTGKPADDEESMFKVLSKFNGYPVVSETGKLIYVFPAMRTRSSNASYALIPPMLEVKPWRFTVLSREQLQPVYLLAVVNFAGSLFFWYLCLFTSKPLWHPSLFFTLAIYGSLFLLVPMVRFLVVASLNREIAMHNLNIRAYENEIGSPSPALLRSLEDAETVRREEHQLGT